MKITPKVGYIMQFLGGFHIALGFFLFAGEWGAIISDGGFDSLGLDYERNTAMWFTYLGIPFITIGSGWNYIQKHAPEFKPSFLGWHLLWMGLICIYLAPVSGGWSLLILGLWLLIENRNK
jgi:hypothetical protein